MAELRRKRKERLLAQEGDGCRVCVKCFKLKRESEFTTNRKDGQGRKNKLCDSCLTSVYLSDSRRTQGFCEIWWRKRAYTCNTAFRNMTAKQKGLPLSAVKLSDLPYVCKPQDIIAIYDKQSGQCHYCRVMLTPDNTSVDHAQPKSKGGHHHPDNFRITCGDCNRLKHDRTEVEFRDFVSEFVKRFQVVEPADKEPLG
jgi:5-methylcytosine-specific restriction endonuclease McrA